jgi:hypothetical protein
MCEPVSRQIPCKQGKIQRISPENAAVKAVLGEYQLSFV